MLYLVYRGSASRGGLSLRNNSILKCLNSITTEKFMGTFTFRLNAFFIYELDHKPIKIRSEKSWL